MRRKKIKLIIDTDPGVDDATALVFALTNPRFDIKLFTITNGNIPMSKATRNMCHILDLFNKDIPVVVGRKARYGNNTEDAIFLHGKEGLGAYQPPKTTNRQPVEEDCTDLMFKIIKENPHEITLVVLGPHTNLAKLLIKYPEAKKLLKRVVMMGGAPDGIKTNPNHNSFNIRTDAPAFAVTTYSKLRVIMCPSSIGRDIGYFTEEQVNNLKNYGDVGSFLYQTFQTFWEPNYPQKIIANNDLCALYFLINPFLFFVRTAFVKVDTKEHVGKTIPKYNLLGNFKIVKWLYRRKFIKEVFNHLEKIKDIKLNFKTEQ